MTSDWCECLFITKMFLNCIISSSKKYWFTHWNTFYTHTLFAFQTSQPPLSVDPNIASLPEVQPSSFHKLGDNVLLSSAATGPWIVTTAGGMLYFSRGLDYESNLPSGQQSMNVSCKTICLNQPRLTKSEKCINDRAADWE